ncbi:MAG: hypothetical protein WCO68_08585 [Verrucomicrobiota bacterium]
MPDLQSVPQTSQPQGSPSPGARLLDLGVFLLILGCGCWFWLYFYGDGHLSLSFEDWPLQAYYLNITRLGLSHGQIPWIGNWSAHATDKFLVVPETLIAPDLFLLPWLSNGMFVALHTCLLFGAGVWGWWAVKKRLGWSREAFLLATVATSFNGFVVSHLAAGHLMWCGCFLAPWVLLGLLGILAPNAPRFSWLPLAFSLFALFLLGAFHLAIWWFFFIGMVVLARPKAILPAFYAVAGACAMALFRILPAKLFITEKFAFLSGYPSLRRLLEGFTLIKGYTMGDPSSPPFTVDLLGWWEFDHYTGWALLLFVVLGALGALIFRRKDLPFALPMAGASLGMALLSYGNVYSWIYPIPLFHTERVATRLIAMSFLGLFFLALTGLERASAGRGRLFSRLLCLGLLAFVLHDFWAAAHPWLLFKLEAATPFSYYFPELEKHVPALLPKAHQLGYKTAVIASTLFSLVCFLVLSALFWRMRLRTGEKSR